MKFEFSTATRIIFGEGTFSELGNIASQMGIRGLVVSNVPNEIVDSAVEHLKSNGITTTILRISTEPTTHLISEGVQLARDFSAHFVIGLGGGSAIDAAKAIAALLTNPGDLLDYLEIIGKDKLISNRSAPFIAIPSTAGTGAEVTRNAVIYSPEHQVKVSMRSPQMLAHVALIDPELTYSMPPAVTASTGLDALTQLIEPFLSNAANPLTDALCREGIQRASRSLHRAYINGNDSSARHDMAVASLFGGLALANSKLGAVHGFAGPLGGMFAAPHGAICACLLPYVIAINARLIQRQPSENAYLQRFKEFVQLLTGNSKASIQDGVNYLGDLTRSLNIPPLSSYGVTKEHFPTIIEKAAKASSMKGNPVLLSYQDMEEILTLAL